ncbi:hypothetical protein [Solimicrobium silvestre]|uniref:Putative glycosyl transferase n=1 Tax=Solimicrobium silvestre TaxID=2099400 RepID=A0A2S9H308_9BURK|nr:hypothetical protein [Solimicrobium silvestre]PRC94350.1 putative glycosyl transferase [Solimicrobium silvestre]
MIHRQMRVLLFCHDAKGLGHLRRISRIAASLQGDFSCLIMTGMTESHWMVPQECETIKLPSWDGISAVRAKRYNRPRWLHVPIEEAVSIRSRMIASVSEAFQPDAILVDYLPFGINDELRPLLKTTTARKYFIHRGIADSADADMLFGAASQDFGEVYDRIIVTADRRIVDVVKEYKFVPNTAAKTVYVGYVWPPQANHTHGTSEDAPRVVCSCGGGTGGGALLAACIDAARMMPNCNFDVIVGPHGAVPITASLPINCHITMVHKDLTSLHQNAAVVVTHGGYNSVIEAASGGARILVYHLESQTPDSDERIHFEQRLSRYYPVTSVKSLQELTNDIKREVSRAMLEGKAKFVLESDALPRINMLLKSDLMSPKVRQLGEEFELDSQI